MTVDQIIEALQAGKEAGGWLGDAQVKMCSVWPYRRDIERVATSDDYDALTLAVEVL